MTAGSILAEMPSQVRRMHRVGGTATTRERQREGGPAAVRKVAIVPARRGHVRQKAMVWDDLVSVLRVEMMRAERGGKPVVETLDYGPSVCVEGRLRGGCDRKTQSLQGMDRPSRRFSDGGILGDVPCKSPPRVERMAYCFDATDDVESHHGRLRTAIGRMARRLSPPVVARMARRLTPPSLARRPLRFGPGFSDEASHGHSTRTLDTYISDDSEDDDDDTSSLEYSDDDSDVERAILASAAAFGGLSMNDNVVHDDFRCAICLERSESGSRAKVSGCSHQFCFRCIDQWAEARRSCEDGAECPLCKKGFHWALSSRRMRWY